MDLLQPGQVSGPGANLHKTSGASAMQFAYLIKIFKYLRSEKMIRSAHAYIVYRSVAAKVE